MSVPANDQRRYRPLEPEPDQVEKLIAILENLSTATQTVTSEPPTDPNESA